jgi:hypothetical protein
METNIKRLSKEKKQKTEPQTATKDLGNGLMESWFCIWMICFASSLSLEC